MEEKKIIVLFTCFNRKNCTIRTINNLSKQYKNISFLIVDDLSTDGTITEINKIKNLDIKTLITKGNMYYTNSMRIGMEYLINNKLNYDYLLLINDDVDFESNFLSSMVKYADKNECVVGGATYDDDGKLSYGGYKFFNKYNADYIRLGPNDSIDCDTINGNCVLIPYNYFLKTGPMDSHYSHYIGDTDYGFKLRKNGYRIKMYNKYIGKCNRNSVENTWLDKKLSRRKRLKLKGEPKGYRFNEYFYYYYKNFSLFLAIKEAIRSYALILLKK